MSERTPVVFIVDDDVSVRESLELLVRTAGFQPQTFASAEEFLLLARPASPSCLILDIVLPDLNGLELQKRIAHDRADMPIIFISGHGDVPKASQAMKAGAIEFLTKPFSADEMLGAINYAILRSRTASDQEAHERVIRRRYDSLTPRERQVMALVVVGRLNKHIAHQLGISVVTVKAHRGNVMRKMAARTLPDLIAMAATLGLWPSRQVQRPDATRLVIPTRHYRPMDAR